MREEKYIVHCLDSIGREALQKQPMIMEKKRKRNFMVAVMTVSPLLTEMSVHLALSHSEKNHAVNVNMTDWLQFISFDQGTTCDTICKRTSSHVHVVKYGSFVVGCDVVASTAVHTLCKSAYMLYVIDIISTLDVHTSRTRRRCKEMRLTSV